LSVSQLQAGPGRVAVVEVIARGPEFEGLSAQGVVAQIRDVRLRIIEQLVGNWPPEDETYRETVSVGGLPYACSLGRASGERFLLHVRPEDGVLDRCRTRNIDAALVKKLRAARKALASTWPNTMTNSSLNADKSKRPSAAWTCGLTEP
jgi:hypothetical protein